MLFKSHRFVCMDCGRVTRLSGRPANCDECAGEIVPLSEIDSPDVNSLSFNFTAKCRDADQVAA